MLDPVALQMLQNIPLPNLPGNVDNLQYTVAEKVNYWNFSQRVDVNFNDNFKIFARVGVFKADLYQANPIGGERRLLPALGQQPRRHEHRRRRGVDPVEQDHAQRARQLLQHGGRVLQPVAAARRRTGSPSYWPNEWYTSLYNSGYAYYPALDVTSGTATNNTTNRLGRQGREWYQHPDAWTMSARMNRYERRAQPEVGRRDARLLRRGGALRADQPRLQFGAHRQQLRRPQVATTGNQWASFMLGALDNQTSARLVPLQTTELVAPSRRTSRTTGR